MPTTFDGPTFSGVALTLDWVERAVACVTLTRPAQMNTLSHEFVAEFDKALDLVDVESTRALIVTGQDRAFCCGAHLRYFAGPQASILDPFASRDPYFARIAVLFDRLEELACPTIAAVNGFALGGGCELAMHCDIIIAGQSARFGQPEVKVGIMPGAGGTQRLTRAVGKFRANLYLMSGRTFDAPTALTMGLVSEVVADAEVESAALKLAGEIAALPPLSLKFIKEATALADNAPLDAALEFERRACQFLFSTADKNEGMSAFLEKRKPGFAGR